jgi:hypothetical protein
MDVTPSLYLTQMPKSNPTTRKRSAETRAKISATRRAQEDEKRALLSQIQQTFGISKKEAKTLIAESRRDSQFASYLSLSAASVKSYKESGQSGRMREWADFCDQMMTEDMKIQGLIQIRTNQVAGKPLSVQATEDNEEAKQCAAFVEDQLSSIRNLNQIAAHLLKATFTGVAVS